LTDRWVPTYDLVRHQRRAKPGLRSRFRALVDILFGRDISIGGVDGFVTAVYRSGGWLLFTRPVLALLAVVALLGFLVFERVKDQAIPLARVLAGDGW